jgi:DeoR/GlpR family transcriptional regulator of sugar metabolism
MKKDDAEMIESPKSRLSKATRHDRIVAELRAAPTLRVLDLASDLGVSTETIRRDLDELESRGLINRTYGGAVRPFGPEPAIQERHRMMTVEREAMAVEAMRFVKHSDILMIGAGATTVHVARRLAAEKRDLTVITHSFGVATVLAPNPTFTILICPGRYNGREGFMFGSETLEYLSGFYANHAILGATGLTIDGPNDADAEAGAVYRTMITRAAETMVVADHTKFDRPALSIYGRWAEVRRLISDEAPTGALGRALERGQAEIVTSRRK